MAEVTGCDSGRIFPTSLGSACETDSHRLLIAGVEVNPRLHPALLPIGMKAAVLLPGNRHNEVDWTPCYAVVIRPGGLDSKHSGHCPTGRA